VIGRRETFFEEPVSHGFSFFGRQAPIIVGIKLSLHFSPPLGLALMTSIEMRLCLRSFLFTERTIAISVESFQHVCGEVAIPMTSALILVHVSAQVMSLFRREKFEEVSKLTTGKFTAAMLQFRFNGQQISHRLSVNGFSFKQCGHLFPGMREIASDQS